MPGYDVRCSMTLAIEVHPERSAMWSSSCRCRPAACRRSGTPISGFATCLTEFPGYYKTADAGYIDEDGYLFIMARTDDIINVAGHRLSTGAMEEVLRQPS
jgi:propionyl-CoA synthetase